MVSNTGWTSVGELEMTRRMSPVAVWYSSELGQLARALLLGLEQPRVLDCDHRLIGKGGGELDLLVREGADG